MHPGVSHTHRPAVPMMYVTVVDKIIISRLAVQIKQFVSLIFVIKRSSVETLLTPSFSSFFFFEVLLVPHFLFLISPSSADDSIYTVYETIGSAEAYLRKVDFARVHFSWAVWRAMVQLT